MCDEYSTLSEIQVPTLTWAGSKDDLTSADDIVRPIYDELSPEKKYWANITDAGHYSFSNACDLVSTYPDCGPGFLEHTEVHHLVNTVTTAFLQKYRGMENMDDFLPVVDDRISWEQE